VIYVFVKNFKVSDKRREKMLYSAMHKKALGILVMFCILAVSGMAHAALNVSAVVSPAGGGLFHYVFTIQNTGPDDVAIVSVDAPVNDLYIDPSLSAPAGFIASYDPGLGFVDFLEDTDLFAAGTIVDGFAFDSSSGPADGSFQTFEALTVNGDKITGNVTLVSDEPAVINSSVTFVPLGSTFKTVTNTSGCPAGFVGKFSFKARLTNKSNSQLSDLLVKVATLSNGNLLQNADGGPGGVGAVMTVPQKNGYSDGILIKNEFVDVPFIICLKQKKAFSFFVDVLGIAE